jgi:hypothetical protein
MRTLARYIERELESGEWPDYTIYEEGLQRLWAGNEKDREKKIRRFAKKYGFRLRFYKEGLCAVFDRPRAVKVTKTRARDRQERSAKRIRP